MKLYAATNEYGDIFPETIRLTPEECERATVKSLGKTDWAGCDALGMYIAEFDDPAQFAAMPLDVRQGYDATLTYVKGFRSGQVVQAPCKPKVEAVTGTSAEITKEDKKP